MMSFLRRASRLSKFIRSFNARNQIYRLINSDSDVMFHLDKNALHRSLKVEGIPVKYEDTVASIMKEAAEEMTTDIMLKIKEEYFEVCGVLVGFEYYFGYCCVRCMIDESRKHPAFSKQEEKDHHNNNTVTSSP